MKNIISQRNRVMLAAMAILFSALLSGGATQAVARDGHQYDYRDRNGNYQHYGYHHNHRGYWHQQNGLRVWINL